MKENPYVHEHHRKMLVAADPKWVRRALITIPQTMWDAEVTHAEETGLADAMVDTWVSVFLEGPGKPAMLGLAVTLSDDPADWEELAEGMVPAKLFYLTAGEWKLPQVQSEALDTFARYVEQELIGAPPAWLSFAEED